MSNPKTDTHRNAPSTLTIRHFTCNAPKAVLNSSAGLMTFVPANPSNPSNRLIVRHGRDPEKFEPLGAIALDFPPNSLFVYDERSAD